MEHDDVIHELEEELKEIGVANAIPEAVTPVPAPPAVPASDPLSAVSPATPATSAPTAPVSALVSDTAPTLAAAPAPVAPPLPAPATPEVPAVPAPAAPPTSAAMPAATSPAPAAEQGSAAPEAIVPPVPTPSPIQPNTPEHHEVMGQVLTKVIERGKMEVPSEPDPMVSKPHELESWRVFKIMSEFVEGFEILRKYTLAASVFGSARTSFAARYYEDATALTGLLAKDGFAIITGGSAGIMEAANKGAYEAGGASIGLNIRLDSSQGLNKYLTDSITFEHFFVRKVMLTFASEVYIYFPGGFGTLDEFTEIITLVQTRKIRKIPIVLYGRDYWEPFTKIFDERLCKEYGAVDAADLDLYRVVDSVQEAHEYILQSVKKA